MAQQSVLIVDDQAGILKLVGHMFQEEGFDVYIADNGEKALEQVKDVRPDLVILDVTMPGMSGIEVCRHLRANDDTSRIPIIMLSAKSQVPDKLEGFEAGADDYVAKPVARAELLARSRALLARASFAQPTKAQIITFIGAKGGVGTTTLAINTAVSLMQEQQTVTLVELRDSPGTAVFQLHLTPEQDLGKLLTIDPIDLTPRHIRRTISHHQSGLQLLPAPQQPTNITITAKHVASIVEALNATTSFLFFDLPGISGVGSREVLEQADQIILVTEPEILSVKAAARTLQILKSWSLIDNTFVVAVSRAPSAMLMRQEEIVQVLTVSPEKLLTIVPPSTEGFQQASRVGKPITLLKPDVLPSKAIQGVAQWLIEQKSIPTTVPI